MRLILLVAAVLAATAAEAQSIATHISAGINHTCAVTAQGAAQCWGNNSDGQLGDGSFNTLRTRPVNVLGATSGIAAISAGFGYTCALTTSGIVRCWGDNLDGELAVGSTAAQVVRATDVTGLPGRVTAVRTGINHTCAVTESGGLWCWGSNQDGAIGPGFTGGSSRTPVAIPGYESGVVDVGTGYRFSCLLTRGGSVRCWGNSQYYMIGDGTITTRAWPTEVLGLVSGVKSIAVAHSHSCAVTAAGGVTCWGLNNTGQLGIGNTELPTTPQQVRGLEQGVQSVVVSGSNSCAVTTAGGVKCWGEYLPGAGSRNLTPVDVPGLGFGVAEIALSGRHLCALTRNGAVKCMGLNHNGALGDGTTLDRQSLVTAGTFTGGPVRSYEGLWWKSPAGSESGWGVNLAQQGEILFATWFTYDASGRPLWLVMSNGKRTGESRWTGTLYETAGPAFTAVPWEPARVAATAVGSATFDFTDGDNGTFTHVVGGVSRTKAITRQVYAAPVPTCEVGGSTGASPSYQGLWWRTGGAESGWGLNITHQGDTLFATWFTYDASGRRTWLVISSATRSGPGTYSGTLYRTAGPAYDAAAWNPGAVVATAVGTGILSFTDADTGAFTYTLDGITQSKPIGRQIFSSPTTACR
jgi:alpha-tubulin suppressor-like RCC1 family protein